MKEFTEEYIIACAKKYRKLIFPELETNLCLEHYNATHKTNLTENDIELNPTNCWICKKYKDRQ